MRKFDLHDRTYRQNLQKWYFEQFQKHSISLVLYKDNNLFGTCRKANEYLSVYLIPLFSLLYVEDWDILLEKNQKKKEGDRKSLSIGSWKFVNKKIHQGPDSNYFIIFPNVKLWFKDP